MSDTPTILVHSNDMAWPMPDPTAAQGGRGDLTQELMAADQWTDEMVAAAGIPVSEAPIVSVGGGIGSFTLVDILRIAGVPTSSIRVLSNLDVPWQTYEYLTRVSQIPRKERLRSDSSSTPDNVWGFPSYAVREAYHEKTLAPLMSVVLEPVFTDYWTPKANQVFTTMEREARRVGYLETLAKGQVRMVRRRIGGGYFTILTPPQGASATKRVAFKSRFVHLAIGYPGLKFLPDLQEYRTKYHDHTRVVNAYEPHEHVYESLLSKGGTVMVRGGGIVASRVLQRLMEDRTERGAQTRILHLFRTYVAGNDTRWGLARRRGSYGFAYQGFNWPKSTWGGQLKSKFERLEGDDRKALYEQLGGAHTPYRKLWQKEMAQSRSEGWYTAMQGEAARVTPAPDGRLQVQVMSANTATSEYFVDFIIDATGLEGDIRDHRLLADLLDHSGAGRNPIGRLDVERSFEVRGTRSGPGRMYASGAMTLGGYFAGVDTFLGLQYASLWIADDLARQGFGKRIGVGRSISQWFKWARSKPPRN